MAHQQSAPRPEAPTGGEPTHLRQDVLPTCDHAVAVADCYPGLRTGRSSLRHVRRETGEADALRRAAVGTGVPEGVAGVSLACTGLSCGGAGGPERVIHGRQDVPELRPF